MSLLLFVLCLPYGCHMAQSKYESQRAKRVPPHVSLSVLRAVSGLTLEQVCSRVTDYMGGTPFTRGALSGIENGHRGASLELLAALEIAYGVRPGDIVTDYLPRSRELVA